MAIPIIQRTQTQAATPAIPCDYASHLYLPFGKGDAERGSNQMTLICKAAEGEREGGMGKESAYRALFLHYVRQKSDCPPGKVAASG